MVGAEVGQRKAMQGIGEGSRCSVCSKEREEVRKEPDGIEDTSDN
jgi:hypothetical protein